MKKGKKTSARMGAFSATLHQPGYREKQDRQPLYVAALTAKLQVFTLTLK